MSTDHPRSRFGTRLHPGLCFALVGALGLSACLDFQPPPDTETLAGEAVGAVSGSALLQSDAHTLEVTVGDPVAMHELKSPGYTLSVGIGAVQPVTVPAQR